MTHNLRISFFATLLIALVVLAPSFVRAQLPPATVGSHPAATPPTKAPSKALPATPLPNGSLKAPTASSAVTGGTASTSAVSSSGNIFSFGNGTVLSILIGIGILALAGLGWFLVSRRNNLLQTEVAEEKEVG